MFEAAKTADDQAARPHRGLSWKGWHVDDEHQLQKRQLMIIKRRPTGSALEQFDSVVHQISDHGPSAADNAARARLGRTEIFGTGEESGAHPDTMSRCL